MTNAICNYDFTLPAGVANIDDVKKLLRILTKKWAFQLEKSEGGYLHYQGRFSLKLKTRLTTLKKSFYKEAHLSPTSNENRDNMFYVMKDETRVDGPWTNKDKAIYIPRQYRGKLESLRPWQKTIWDSYNNFDDRKINIIIDPDGEKGKTVICALIHLYGRGIDFPPMKNAEALLGGVCDKLMDNEIREPGIITFDIPRAQDQNNLGELFTAIETIKKGYCYDPRYHFREWWFDSPSVWIFTNSYPNLGYLTTSRWLLWEISSAEGDLIPIDLKWDFGGTL